MDWRNNVPLARRTSVCRLRFLLGGNDSPTYAIATKACSIVYHLSSALPFAKFSRCPPPTPAAGATRTAPTTTDRHSTTATATATTTTITKRIRSEAAAAAGGADPPSWTANRDYPSAASAPEATTASSKSSSSATGLRGSFDVGQGGSQDDDKLAGKLMAGMDGRSAVRGDLASKLIEEGAGAGARARDDEEFAAILAEAFGSRGREGELAEKLLAGLGEGGERQQLLAAKLLAGLDVSQQGGGGGGGGGRKYEPATEADRAAAPDLGGRGAVGPSPSGEEQDEEGKLSAAVAEALDRIRRHEAEGGEGGGVLEHVLTRLMNYKEGDGGLEEKEELPPPRGLVKEHAWRGGDAAGSYPDGNGNGDGDAAVLVHEDAPREWQGRNGLLPLTGPPAAAAADPKASQRIGGRFGGNDAPLGSGNARLANRGFVDDLPTANAAQRADDGAAAGSEDPAVESLPSQLAGAFRRTFAGFLRPFRVGSAERNEHEDGHGDGLMFGDDERTGRSALERRRLQTSSEQTSDEEISDEETSDEQTAETEGGNSGNMQLEIVSVWVVRVLLCARR